MTMIIKETPKEIKSRKVKYLSVSTQIIADICKKAIENKVPNDSEVVRIMYNALRNEFDVVIYSDLFPEVPEGNEIPRLKEPVISSDVI
jgi:hypothetical protein